jgi:hypothetical protein
MTGELPMRERLIWFVPIGVLIAGLIGLRMVRAEHAPRGHQSPAEFDLPTFPGGYDFKSSSGNPMSQSVAYLINGAGAVDVADYYRTAMAARGYELEQDTPLNMPVPASPGGGPTHRVPGRRLLFVGHRNNRAVMLMAVEQPLAKARTQVALMFGPISAAAPPNRPAR